MYSSSKNKYWSWHPFDLGITERDRVHMIIIRSHTPFCLLNELQFFSANCSLALLGHRVKLGNILGSLPTNSVTNVVLLFIDSFITYLRPIKTSARMQPYCRRRSLKGYHRPKIRNGRRCVHLEMLKHVCPRSLRQ